MLKPFKVVKASLGLGLMSQAITPINSDIGTKIGQAGESAAGFIKPSISISMSGHLIKQLKSFKKK